MSIELLKEKKVRAIQSLLNRNKGSFFSEGLSEAFKVDGKPYEGRLLLADQPNYLNA